MKILILLLCTAAWTLQGMVTPADPSSPLLSSVLGRRSTTTPTASVRKDRDDNQKRIASERPPVDTVAPEPAVNTTKGVEGQYPRGYKPGREGVEGNQLPVYLFLEQSRVVGMLDLCTKDVHKMIEQWCRDNEASPNFTGTPTSTGRLLAEMVKRKDVASYYGLERANTNNQTRWLLSTSSLAKERTDARFSFSLPAGWAEEYGADGTWSFKANLDGTPISVSVSKPGPNGYGVLENIVFHHQDVTAMDDFRTLRKVIHTAEDLRQMLSEVVRDVGPCAGVRATHYGEMNQGGAYGSLSRAACRNGPPCESEGIGHFPPFPGEEGVSATLHVLGDVYVFRSGGCSAVAGKGSPLRRCEACRSWQKNTFSDKMRKAATPTYKSRTNNTKLDTGKKEAKLKDLAQETRRLRDRLRYMEQQLRRYREDDIVIAAENDQGRKIHEALSKDPDVTDMFSKLPEGSLARAVVEDMMDYNKREGSKKGWRFNPKVLRWACYALAKMGTAGYRVLQDVLHLPSVNHVRKIQAAAATPKMGVQYHLIEAYAKMACEDNLGRFDLCGILVWDLMHLNTNGFRVCPNGGGIEGLVDRDSFFRHPLDAVKGIDEHITLEETLEEFVATQYLEVFWVSIGNPKYKFCVYREAVKGLNGPKISRMLDEIMVKLYEAHEDKNFDVIGTVCDGAAEHRSFQQHCSTSTFSEWADPASDLEQRHADYGVAFDHPHHGRPVFNLSDPVHLLKKVVNALWHSGIPDKQRDLQNLWWPPGADEPEWVSFSLKTLETAWVEEELGGGRRSDAEQSAHLRRFLKFDPEMFKRNSHNCMSVKLSAKCVSRTAMRVIASAQGKLLASNQPPSGQLACYSELAEVMNDFLDVMNGIYGVNTVDLEHGEKKRDGYITAADCNPLRRLLEVLEFFDHWQLSLRASFPGKEWKDHFITDKSWSDMRTTILGFVSMSRYIFSDEDLVAGKNGRPGRFLYPRMFSQDILEHRFSHIRSGMGTHKAPTSTQAFRQGQHGDTCRISHGDKRRNSSRSAGPFEIQTTAGIRAALPVNASERAEVVRAATWADDDHVFETRSSCCVTNCEMCGV